MAYSESRDKLWDRYRETRDTVSAAGLYNGNISWMSTDLPRLGSNRMQAMVYGYDQLHRIVQARSLTEYDDFSNRMFGCLQHSRWVHQKHP